MANHIDDVPDEVTPAGQAHDYPENFQRSTVVLVNAPLDTAHRNVGVNRGEYNAFIEAEITAERALVLEDQNVQDPYRDLGVPISIDEASKYNYARITIGTREWFVFCTPQVGNKTMTRFVTTVDEWPSFDWSLGYSPIARGHVGVATSQSDTYGDLYCTTPEPVTAVPTRSQDRASILDDAPDEWTVVVISVNDLRGNGTVTPYFEPHVHEESIALAATIHEMATWTLEDINPDAHPDHPAPPADVPQSTIPEADYPWQYGYGSSASTYVPSVTPSAMSTIDGVAAGGGVYLFTQAGFRAWIGMMQGAPWVVSGIVDVRLVPSWSVPAGGDSSVTDGPTSLVLSPLWNVVAGIPVFVSELTTAPESFTVLDGWRDDLLAAYGATYYRKLLTAPYTEIVISNGTASTSYRPEQWHADGVDLNVETGAVHGENVMRATPASYSDLGREMSVDVPTGGNAGLAKSGYGMAASNPGMTDFGPALAAANALNGKNALERQYALAVEILNQKTQMTVGVQGIQAGVQAIQGAAGGMILGGPPGALLGAAGGAASGAVGVGMAFINGQNSQEIQDMTSVFSGNIATFLNGIPGIANANNIDIWHQSMRAASGVGTGERLASAWHAVAGRGLDVLVVVPSSERIYALLSEWRRYGYTVDRTFRPSRLDVMSKFSYWRTSGATIVGEIPAAHKATIAAAFDGEGVTVWNHIGEIGTDQTGANTPIAGTYY